MSSSTDLVGLNPGLDFDTPLTEAAPQRPKTMIGTGVDGNRNVGTLPRLWLGARRLEIAELEQRLRDTQARLAGVVRLQQCAGPDDLTGPPAYRRFHTVLRREWRRAQCDHVALSLLELSIEDLTAYNDEHGRAAGDAVLKHVASELESVTRRSSDMAARLLGTRFVAVLPNTSKDGAVFVARRFRANIDAALTMLAADKLVIHVGTATMHPDRAAIWEELELKALAHRALALATQQEDLVSLSDDGPQPPPTTPGVARPPTLSVS